MRAGAIGAVLVVMPLAIATGAGHRSAADRQDIAVGIVIGSVRVSLNVRLHVADLPKGLPRPGELAVADEHDRSHGARTYCYRYEGGQGSVLLELFDSDFGMHMARLSRVGRGSHAKCPVVSSEPRVAVGKQRYDLKAVPRAGVPGFRLERRGDSSAHERQWTYSDPSRPHMWGTCFTRLVSLTIEPNEGIVRSLTVDNWEEPGC